ncbi:MAG: hypothetical protein HYT10_03200 [Candidatus Levybacteria bacterium]|nr:hypothetical protein [Candidatus Levybacteria bacterium]
MVKALIVGLFILSVIAITLFSLRSSSNSFPKGNTPKPEEKASVAQTTLSFSPDPLTVSEDTGKIDLIIDTGKENKVTAVQVAIKYNPRHLPSVDITPGSFFQNPIVLFKKIDDKKGIISFAVALPPGSGGENGQGTFAHITFTTERDSNEITGLQFLPETVVAATHINTSTLKEAINGRIVIQVPEKQPL